MLHIVPALLSLCHLFTMAWLGIDIGDQSCLVGTVLCGGIEILTNDVTDRITPAVIAFRDNDRQMGSIAKSQIFGNYRNTVFGIKNLLGRDYNDPIVQHEVRRLPFKVGQYPNSAQVGINVNVLGVETWFTPTQIYSMLLRHIADNAEKTLSNKIISTVISVPSHFTDIQRRAVVDAAKLAGVDLQGLLNDGNALALAYGIYKNDLPGDGQPPRIVAFVDFGHTSFQVNIFAFTVGKAICLSCVSYPNLGGRDFDERLFNYFSAQFNQKYEVNILETKKSCLKLLSECERLKKLLSANITSIPINIECLLGDYDFTSRMNRTEFDGLCGDLFLRIQTALQEAILLSKIDLRDLYSVELVGGTCRMPSIARLVRAVFCKEVSRTLNFDETVVKGCAIQSALLSPTIHTRLFHVVGVIPYSIKIKWLDDETGVSGEMNAFIEYSPSNLSKVFSFYMKSDFQIECSYKNVTFNLHQNPFIATFTIRDVRATGGGQLSKVKVKMIVDNNGILTIPNVELVTRNTKEIMCGIKYPFTLLANKISENEGTSLIKNHSTSSKIPNLHAVSDLTSDEVITMTDVAPKPHFKDNINSVVTKLNTNPPIKAINSARDKELPLSMNLSENSARIFIPVITDARSMTHADFDKAIEIERKLTSQDLYQADKANSKNALEEYVYDIQDRLDTFLGGYFREEEKFQFKKELERIRHWLLNDDAEEEPSVYKEYLKELRLKGDPGNIRYIEFQNRTVALNELADSLARLRCSLSEFNYNNAEHQNVDSEKIAKVNKVVNEKESWLEEQLQALHNQSSKFTDHEVTTAEIFEISNTLDSIFISIMSDLKPSANENTIKDTCP